MSMIRHTALAALALTGLAAQATEGGTSVYPVGTENYVCCALPPPGLYGMAFVQSYSADKARGDDGSVVTPPNFKVRANALAARLVYVTPGEVLGGSLGLHAILPVVNLKVTAGPMSESKSGLGDVTFGPVLGFHHSPQLHSVVALDIVAPTGAYDVKDPVNIGKNHWAFQPVVGVSYIDPKGLNADAKVMYTFSSKNKDTQTTDGDEFIIDYSLGWGLGNGWVVGAGGYVYRQTTEDTGPNAGGKGKAFAIGPSIKYDSGKGWFVTAKYQQEMSVRNRAEGSAFWLKAVMPF